MPSPAILAKSQFSIKSGSLFLDIIGITSLAGPTLTRATIETTNHNSTAFEYLPAPFYDAGTFDFSLQFAPTNSTHNYLLLQAQNTGSNIWLFRMSDNSKYEFSGSLSDFGIKAGNAATDVLMVDAKVKITGNINFSSTSSIS